MPNGPDDPDGNGRQSNSGDATFVIVGVVLALFVIVLVASWVAGASSSNQNTNSSSTTPPQCSSSCSAFLRWECPGNRFMGGCLGFAVCDKPIHTCGVNPPGL